MTPIWRQHMKRLLNAKNGPDIVFRDVMASARCFDMTAVDDLVEEVGLELRVGAKISQMRLGKISDQEVPSQTFEVDLSASTCLPAPVTWLEWRDAAVLIASASAATPFDDAGAEKDAKFVIGALPVTGTGDEFDSVFCALGALSISDGHALVGRIANLEQAGTALRKDNLGTGWMFMGLAGLAIISSKAVRREPIASHAGLARKVRSVCPPRREIIHTRVIIGGNAEVTESGGRSANPKAYHFCRAHRRRLPTGEMTSVRAHWRGDIAYGVRLPTYAVAPAAAA